MNWPNEQSLNPNRLANDLMLSVVVVYRRRVSLYFSMLWCAMTLPLSDRTIPNFGPVNSYTLLGGDILSLAYQIHVPVVQVIVESIS